jgi:hypothetical protein
MYKRKLMFFLIFNGFALSLFAQSAGLNFTLGFPSGEFKDQVKRTGIGLSGQFLLFTPNPALPFSAGINIGYLNYGSESRLEPFSSTIPDVTVDVDRTNNLVNFHVLFQLIPPSGIVRPYLEGLFGGAYLFTETSIKSRGTEEVASSTNYDDFAWSYGGGGGFMIQVAGPSDDFSSIFIDLKARYLLGSEAEYLKEGSVTIEPGRVIYNPSKSKTDLITANIGVVLYFNTLFE